MEKFMIEQRVRSDARASSFIHELMVLFKMRIVVLLLFAAVGGYFLGTEGHPEWTALLALFVAGALSAMGSSALNEYIERDKDALMKRTKRRPLVTGAFAHPGWVPYVATAMIALPVLAILPFNWQMALFLAAGAFVYVVIYTLWLKPRTSLNIVIGGAAGSFAVMAGGAAAGKSGDPGVLALAVLLFFWTPIHFWALALVYRDDYARAGIPMLPVTTTPRIAAFWGLLHGIAAGVTAVAMALQPGLGPVYLVPVLAITVALLVEGAALVADPSKRRAYRVFHTSNFFLAIVLLAICVSTLLGVPWPAL
jgi:protoheme IX farnesyltransferase